MTGIWFCLGTYRHQPGKIVKTLHGKFWCLETCPDNLESWHWTEIWLLFEDLSSKRQWFCKTRSLFLLLDICKGSINANLFWWGAIHLAPLTHQNVIDDLSLPGEAFPEHISQRRGLGLRPGDGDNLIPLRTNPFKSYSQTATFKGFQRHFINQVSLRIEYQKLSVTSLETWLRDKWLPDSEFTELTKRQ